MRSVGKLGRSRVCGGDVDGKSWLREQLDPGQRGEPVSRLNFLALKRTECNNGQSS